MSQLRFLERWLGRYFRLIYSPVLSSLLQRQGAQVGKGVIFYGKPSIQIASGSHLSISDGCVLCSHAAFTAMGVVRPVTLRTLLPGARLHLSRNVGASGVLICAAISVEVGEEALLGSGCTIVDTDFHPTEPAGRRWALLSSANHAAVQIGENAFIGAGTFIGKGVSVGAGSVVGAMSVVTKDVSPMHVVAGNPARIIRAFVHQV